MRIIRSPNKYVQGQNELSHLHDYASIYAKKAVFAIVDPYVLEHYQDKIEKSFKSKEIAIILEPFGGESSKTEIKRLLELLNENGADVVVGIGGGKTLDTAKAVAYYADLPVIICPSIASTDAPCSALSVIYHDDSSFDEYLFLKQNPNVVLVDTDLIANAPLKLFVAGIGDALATYFEARACMRSNAEIIKNGYATSAAFALSKHCYDVLLEDGIKAAEAIAAKQITKAAENVIEANTYLSGIGFESCGLAAAHAIHNGLTILPETHSVTHGEKVAFGTLTQLVLENAPACEIEELISFCKALSLPTTLYGLGLSDVSEDDIMKVATLSTESGETIHNMPFKVTAKDVCAAIIVADKLGG